MQLAGLLSGYTGGFELKSGETHPDTVPYVAMRAMLATFGIHGAFGLVYIAGTGNKSLGVAFDDVGGSAW